MNWTIYGLHNPRTRELKYVGFTSGDPQVRLKQHIQEAIGKPWSTYRSQWIMSLIVIGLEPFYSVIEVGVGDGWAQAERKWILFYRSQGTALVNATDGGDGIIGWGTAEQRSARVRTGWENNTPEERARRIQRAADGFSREKRVEAGKKSIASRTPEQRSERMLKIHARRTAEEKSIIAGKIHDAQTPEQRSNRIRKIWSGKTPEQRYEAMKNTQTPEAIAKRAISMTAAWGRKTPEERSAIGRKVWEKRRLNASGMLARSDQSPQSSTSTLREQ